MGLSANGTGKVHKLQGLDAATRREIERRIFGPVPEEAKKYYKEYQDRLAVTFDVGPLQTENVFPAGGAYAESDSDDDFHPTSMYVFLLYIFPPETHKGC